MKKNIKLCCLILTVVLLASFLSLPQTAEEYSVPTLYINNRVWHLYSLYPLTEKNGVYLVPSSFIGSIDGIEISFNDNYNGILIQKDDIFISLNTKTSKALLSTGEVIETMVLSATDEYFVDVTLCAEVFDFSVEIEEFFEKTVLRVITEDDPIEFEALVERSAVPEEAIPEFTEAIDAAPKIREKNLAFVADFTAMTTDDQVKLLGCLAESKTNATIVISKALLTGDPLQCVIMANAIGCSFIISASDIGEVRECNDLLEKLMKNRTRLIYGTGNAPLKQLTELGYISLSDKFTTVDSDPSKFGFKKLTVIKLTDFSDTTKENTLKWISAATAKDVYIRPLNCKTGN